MKFLRKWINKFVNAFHGLYIAIKEENSLVFHLISLVVVVIVGILLQITRIEWLIIIIISTLVIVLELLNTFIENLLDFIVFKYNLNVKKLKDLMAATTFIASVSAIIIAIIIFLPHIIKLFS